MILLNISIIIKLLSIFGLIFVLLPRRLFRPAEEDSPLDTFFINLTHMVFITMLLVPLLVILKMYDLLSLTISYILVFASPFLYSLYKDPNRRERLANYQTTITIYLLDILDHRINLLDQLNGYLIKRLIVLREHLRRIDKTIIIYILLVAGVFGYSAYLRLYDSFSHITMGTSDPYTYIKIIKELEMNRLFSEVIYPEGFFSILSVFHLLSFLDLVHIIRFFDPLSSLILVLSVYYLTLKVTSNRWAALVSAFVYGTFTTTQLPSELSRQTTTLVQEFGMIFLLPTLHFLLQYLITRKRRYLFFFFEGLVIIFKVHSIVAIMAFLGVVAITVTGLINRLLSRETLLKVLLGGTAAVGLGHLTILIGLLTGFKLPKLDSSLNMITIFTPQAPSASLKLSPLLWAITIITLFVISYGLFFCRSREGRIRYLFSGLFYLLLIIEYQANYFHLRHIVLQLRSGQFVGLIGTLIMGLSFHLLTENRLTRSLFSKGLYPAITFGTIFILGMAFPAKPPVTFKMGYDAAMANYLRICEDYPPLQWLIVSQVSEYPLALYKGWHMMTFDFLERYSPLDRDLPIDTPHIFIFVEKEIFKIPIFDEFQEDKELVDYDWRWDQMRRMEEWCRTYMVYHDDMSIFYEDDRFIVYAIHKREALEPIIPFKGKKK